MGCACTGGLAEMPEVANMLPNGNAAKANGDSINNNNTIYSNDNGSEPEPADENSNGVLGEEPVGGTSHWIDAALVGHAVGVDPSQVRDVAVKAAVAEGDNYCSCMWRVRAVVGDRDQPVSLIVKAPPKGELMQTFVENLGFFARETGMLKETLPAMREIAVARCGPDHILAGELGPKLLPCSVPGVLIMNDLSLQGFRNTERQGQLDMQHCQTALEILARFHALSVALHREDPSCYDKYGECLYVQYSDPELDRQARMHIETQLTRFGAHVETWDATKGKGLGDKISRLATVVFDLLCECVAPCDGINVLNHGDFWINNMMYRYDGEESVNPKDIRLVDLQLIRFSSPALDLQYFITTSAKEEVRVDQLDVLLQTYCEYYNEYVSALGLEDARWSSLDALREEYLSKSLFGFSAAYQVLSAVVAQPEDRLELDNVTMENMMETDFCSKSWEGKNFQRIIPRLLDYYAERGVLV